MKQTTAPRATTPSPTDSFQPHGGMDRTEGLRSVFISLALDMSWRLALAVLVPLVGGYELDRRWHTTPLLTVIGLALATAGVVIVLRQTLQAVNKLPSASKEKPS